MFKPRQILLSGLCLCVFRVGTLWVQSGIHPYQDIVDVDFNSRGFNSYVNGVNANLSMQRGVQI